MTYGENSRELREAMAWLLERRRIQQRLGGEGNYRILAWSTEAQRERMGQIIQRYRLAALTWCHLAVVATTPKLDLSHTKRTTRCPVDELRFRLSSVVTVPDREALLDLLAAPHGNALVDGWQRLARAAALGEHDFAAGVSFGHLTPAQNRRVVKDAADLTRALVLIDDRYVNVPGWQHLKERTRLGRAAENVSEMLAHQELGGGVDPRGWRPTPDVIHDQASPGLAGVAQSQRNLLVELQQPLNALNLRRVLLSQAQVSAEAARHAHVIAPDLTDTFMARASLYRELVHCSRDVNGQVGGGGPAVAESQNAASRLRSARVDAENESALHQLAQLCPPTNARIAATIEHGFNDKLYFTAVKLSRLDSEPVHGVYPARQRWMTVMPGLPVPLLELARDRLRPPPASPPLPSATDDSRAPYEQVLALEVARLSHPHPAR